MDEKGYVIKDEKFEIINEKAKEVVYARMSGKIQGHETYCRLEEILIPDSVQKKLGKEELRLVRKQLAKIAHNEQYRENYLKKIIDPEKEATKKLRPYL